MQKKLPSLFLILSLLFASTLRSQDIDYAHRVVNTLASPGMHGRGCVNNGCNLAAEYIKSQFDSLKLLSFSNYYQDFAYTVNTFPSDIILNINSKNLIPGKDFIMEGPSGTGHGSFDALIISNHYKHSSEDINQFLIYANKKGQVVVFDYDVIKPDDEKIFKSIKSHELPKEKQPPAILFIENKKLTMGISGEQFSYPIFTVLRKVVPKHISQVSFEVTAKTEKDFKTHNVIGYIKGLQYPDSFIVFTAHFDHLGQMGKEVYFPGANDNASGTAMLLSLANYYSKPGHQQECSIVFIAFAGEEAKLAGSKFFSEHPLIPLKSIKFLTNLDLLGTGEDGIMVVNATEYPGKFQLINTLNKKHNYLTKIEGRGKASISDHYWFTEAGVPSFYIYTLGGIAAYHDIYDKPETLPLTKFKEVFNLIVDFTAELQWNEETGNGNKGASK